MSDALLFATIITVTSAVSYIAGRYVLGLPRDGLRRAVGLALESVGIIVVFIIANTATGFLLVLAFRRVTGQFLTLYAVTDIVLIPLSLIQGLVFWWWRAGRSKPRGK